MQPVKYIYFFIAFFVACMIAVKSLDYFHPDLEHGFLAEKATVFHNWYKYFFYLHITFAPITIFATQ